MPQQTSYSSKYLGRNFKHMDIYLLIVMPLWLHIVYDKLGLTDCLSYFHVSNSALSLANTTVLPFSIFPVFDFFVSTNLTWTTWRD